MPARIKAFLLHLSGSLVVISLFFTTLYGVWYPGYFFELEGVWKVARMVILVDIVVGPFLTLVVYDLRKGLKVVQRDIAVIVLVQIVALGWGVRATYLAHPDYLAFAVDQFYTLNDSELVGSNDDPDLAPSPWGPPKLVFVRPISDYNERTEQLMGFMSGRLPDLQNQRDRYQPYADHHGEIAAAGKAPVQAIGGDAVRSEKFAAFLSQQGGEAGDYLLYTVFAHEREGTLVLARDTLQPVAYLDMIID